MQCRLIRTLKVQATGNRQKAKTTQAAHLVVHWHYGASTDFHEALEARDVLRRHCGATVHAVVEPRSGRQRLRRGARVAVARRRRPVRTRRSCSARGWFGTSCCGGVDGFGVLLPGCSLLRWPDCWGISFGLRGRWGIRFGRRGRGLLGRNWGNEQTVAAHELRRAELELVHTVGASD